MSVKVIYSLKNFFSASGTSVASDLCSFSASMPYDNGSTDVWVWKGQSRLALNASPDVVDQRAVQSGEIHEQCEKITINIPFDAFVKLYESVYSAGGLLDLRDDSRQKLEHSYQNRDAPFQGME